MLSELLSHKAMHDEFYEYYIEVIEDYVKTGNIGKWQYELERVLTHLAICNVVIDGKNVLDISGEPGFFAKGLFSYSNVSNVVVTAYSSKVAEFMQRQFGNDKLECVKYDYNHDKLSKIVSRKFDVILIRWSIGFCEDLISFLEDLSLIMNPHAYIYISYSPYSRAIPARWMFDDYTYILSYSIEFIKSIFSIFGFQLLATFDEGSYRWDKGIHPIQKFISLSYTRKLFRSTLEKEQEKEQFQHNVSLVFKNAKT